VNDKEVVSGHVDSEPAQDRRRLFRTLLALAGLGVTGVLLSQEKTGLQLIPPVQAGFNTLFIDGTIPGVNPPGVARTELTSNGATGTFWAQNTAAAGAQGIIGVTEGVALPATSAVGVHGVADTGTGVWGGSNNFRGVAGFGAVGVYGTGSSVGVVAEAGTSTCVSLRAGGHGVDQVANLQEWSSGLAVLSVVDKNGNFGIGRTNPLGTLHVQNATASTKPIIAQGAENQTANLQEWQDDSGTALSVVDANGNFGIGTISPQSHLFVVDSTTNPSRGIVASQNNSGAQAALMQMTKSRGTQTSPSAVVNGDYVAAFNMNAYDGTSYLGGKPMAGWGAKVNGTVAAGSIPADLFFYTKPSGTLDPYGDSVVRLVIASGGNVGIGTTAPTQRLHVAGNVLANAYQTPSDMRLKTDIEPIDNALDKVLALDGVYFQWNKLAKQSDGRQVGVIAQNVQQVLPEVVLASATANDYLSVDYTKLVPVLIEAMKEQQSTIEQLLGRIAILERTVKQFAAS
jgi:hypothetical protein